MSPLRYALAFAVPLVACAGFSACAAEATPELPGYRLDDYHAPTPATLNGQPILTVADARRLWAAGKAVFIDVSTHPPRPEGLTPGTIWQEKPHPSIPRAVWLPEVGRGELAPQTEEYFRRSLAEVSQGDHDATMVFFCKRACWMSWNAAKRAQAMGYRKVYLYSDGIEGWQEAGLPTETNVPRP